jgi:signal transduction histidine kinase
MNSIVPACNNLAYAWLDKKDTRKAEQYLDTAIATASGNPDPDWLATLYDSYADVMIQKGETTKALLSQKKAYQFRSRADNFHSGSQVRLLSAMLDLKGKNEEIRNHETQLILQGKNIQRLWIVAVAFAFLALFSLFFAWIVRLRGKVRIHEKEMEHTRKLLELETGEKQRLAVQLHDLIGPVRNILLKQVGEMEITDPVIRENLRVQLTEITASLRRLSHRMNSAMLDQLTLGEALETLRHDFPGMAGSKVAFESDPACDNIKGEITGHVFFILLELLTNAVKYAANSDIQISLTVEFDNLYIIYRDNGLGFNPHETTGPGMGLSNIRDRASVLHGQANLESLPGKGTTWTITIPCKDKELSTENADN